MSSSSPRTPNSKKSMRRTSKATPPKRAGSDATSSSADSSDLTSLSDSEGDLSPASLLSPSREYQPDELDEPISYVFQNGDPVWVKTDDGEWLQGTIAGSNTRRGATRQKEGLFFPVAFKHNSRRYFAPLNGDVKPDNAEVRRLLSEGGWL